MPELKSSEPTEDFNPLSPDDARELARLVRLLVERLPSEESSDRARLVGRARTVFNERRRRTQFLPRALFSEPGWDILLALYLTDFAGGRQTTGQLVSWIGAPLTTALRWIDSLESHNLISRGRHPKDTRVVFIDLTDKGRQVLDRYFSASELV
jgi:DNA-binding MarR family transcriptional regulator